MRRSRALLVAGVTGVALVTMGVGTLPTAAWTSTPPPVSFTTPGTTMWTVPAGVTQIRVVANGAKGADTPAQSFYRSTGGAGSRVSATLDVTPGTTLQIDVGVGGGTSAFGGMGGGASDVRIAPFGLLDRLIVAAGGGGAGADSSQCGIPGSGGAGGGGVGGAGPAQHGDCSPGGSGGTGGTANAGGAGGDAFYVTAHHSGDGSFGTGGTAVGSKSTDAVGGGGGGGWFGGGAGGGLYQAFAGSGGGGGGGSDHVAPAARDVVVAGGANSGTAGIAITPLAAATVSFTTTYSRREASRLHQYALRTNRSDADAQHEATLALAGLLDHIWSDHPDQRPHNDGRHADRENGSRRVSVTSRYTRSDAALVTDVARALGIDEPTFQRFAVLIISRDAAHH